MNRTLYSILVILAMFSSCSDDEYGTLTAEQERLIGKAVNFNTSIAEPFATRASYNTDGGFNENDQITIFRQYSNDNGATFDPNSEGYRVYSYQAKNVTGTNIRINTLWKVKTGKEGYEPAHGNIPEPGTFTQTEADSLTWDDGRTVRFRAWGMSNLSGCLVSGSWDNYYPDFFMSSWVTASGPSSDIPLTMRHLGCRIAISPFSGNQLQKIEICTEYEDYMREDNADSDYNDHADKCTEDEAKKRAEAVKAVVNKMCMPGGIDFESGLMAMSNEYKNNHENIKTIEKKEDQEQMIKFNTLSSTDIEEKAVRPVFNNNNGNRYLVTIPHDMSTEEAGKRLTLPSYTRFRVYLRDVNNGDKENTSGYEGEYHIFALDDIAKVDENGNIIIDSDGKPISMFAEGLPLIAGYSYRFMVGYHYNSLKIYADNNFSWTMQDLDAGNLNEVKQNESQEQTYKWWKEAIDKSISEVLTSSDKSFNPVFEINTPEEFIEFVKLVNGTAYNPNPEFKIERGEQYTDETAEGDIKLRWKWYKVLEDGTKEEITKEYAEKAGYIFYHSYYPAEGDNRAYYIENYLNAPYSFYSNLVNRKFKVVIKNDLDFNELKMTTVGSEQTPFLGILDGNNHVLSNIYIPSGYLFDYAGYSAANMHSAALGAVISNLVLHSEQPLCVVNHGKDVKILGIALKAPSDKAAFGEELMGTSYLVGCDNEGDATMGLVGKASDLYMYGCLQTATGIDGGALLGGYADGAKEFFAPQEGKVIWGRFMCNYFDIDHSPNAVAVGGHGNYSYQLQQYIRGTKTYILRAVEDNLITNETDLEALKKNQEALSKMYGLAPWRAMNYAIYRYNNSDIGKLYPCNVHYVINGTYNNRYPLLNGGTPTVESGWNVLELLN